MDKKVKPECNRVILWIVNIKCAWTKVTNRRYCALCHSSWSFLHLQPWGQQRISALVCSVIDLNTASLRSLKADYRTAHTRAYKLRDRVRVFPGVIPIRLLPSAQTNLLCVSLVTVAGCPHMDCVGMVCAQKTRLARDKTPSQEWQYKNLRVVDFKRVFFL